MKKLTIALAFACTAALGGPALAQDANPVSCSIGCGTSYNQCLASNVDWSLVTNPGEASDRMSSNMSAARGCREDAAACYASCSG